MSFTILPDILRLAWPACFTNAAQKSLVRNSTRARMAYRNSSNSRLSLSPQFHTWARYLKPQTAPLAFANRPSVSRMRALCPPVKTPSGSAAFFLYATTAPPKPHSTQVLAFLCPLWGLDTRLFLIFPPPRQLLRLRALLFSLFAIFFTPV